MSQTGHIHMCSYNPVNIKATTTGHDLVSYVNQTIAINRSMHGWIIDEFRCNFLGGVLCSTLEF